jgi:hypothetical protein
VFRTRHSRSIVCARSERRELLYVGEGSLRSRLIAHVRRSRESSHPQGFVFAAAGGLECSWVVNDTWLCHQRLELETDLIGAHVLHLGAPPAGQFLG